MYNCLISQTARYKFNLIKKIELELPQNFPALKKIDQVKLEIQHPSHYTLLNLLVIEVKVNLRITYIGIDDQLHHLERTLSFLKDIEIPPGQIGHINCLEVKQQTDYQTQLPTSKRVRHLGIIFLVRLFYTIEYSLQQHQRRIPRGLYQKKNHLPKRKYRKNNYPWKRIVGVSSTSGGGKINELSNTGSSRNRRFSQSQW